MDFLIIRKPFQLKSVKYNNYNINNKNIALITIKSFTTNTKHEIIKILENYHKNYDINDNNIIILDLRNNGGGVLQSAVDISSLFLKPNKIITFVVNKDGISDALQTLSTAITSTDTFLPDLNSKLYLFVNEQTASAAEVLSAGLKENNRAILIGTKTFGKGIIQNVQELKQGGVAVTIAKYETPLHHNINKIGISVDKELICDETQAIIDCLKPILD